MFEHRNTAVYRKHPYQNRYENVTKMDQMDFHLLHDNCHSSCLQSSVAYSKKLEIKNRSIRIKNLFSLYRIVLLLAKLDRQDFS